VALTDHNTPDGISSVKGPAENQGLTVFPGVEVTVAGIHILCILDPAGTRDDVVALLSKLGIEPPAFGQQEASSCKSVVEAVKFATAAGAIVIAAHVNGPKGLLTTKRGQERLQALLAPGLVAAELMPISAEPVPPGVEFSLMSIPEAQSWLDGSKTYGRRLSQVQGSDSHGLQQAGQRFTWMKMTRPDLEGLRLALLDGEDSLRPSETESPEDPNKHADNVIESITVRQARYMGRWNEGDSPRPFTVQLNPWLNAVIGGRGTGKSTLIDLCRIALHREDELLGQEDSSVAAMFTKRMQVTEDHTEEGLLTDTTAVDVVYRKDGERFVVSWTKEGETRTILRLDGEQKIAEYGDIQRRFPVRIYSQKQLFDLAKQPNALVNVIDDSSHVDGAELRRLRGEAEARYLSMCAEARSLRTQAADLPARMAALSDVRRKLDLLEQGSHAKVLAEYRLRHDQNESWDFIQQSAETGIDDLSGTVDSRLSVADLGLDPEERGDVAATALARAHSRLSEVLVALKGEVLASVARARTNLSNVRNGEDALVWRQAVVASEREYQEVKRQLADAGIANLDEYSGLLQRASALEQEIGRFQELGKEADDKERRAADALREYRSFRVELTGRRTAFATQTSGDLIKVEIRGFERCEDLERFLRGVLGIDRFDGDYRELVKRIVPKGQWEFDKLDSTVEQLRGLLADEQKQWAAVDKRFVTQLSKLQPERIDRLALYVPEDAVHVSFRDLRDTSSAWRGLSQGSPGQQTATLLAFVLGYGCEPIILDQPEDDLDNSLVYELLVQRLREKKQARQVVVVTHNPNIVVHGDAELVVSLDARGGQTSITVAGGLQQQKVRDEICRVMEGGRAAFETRYHRLILSGSREMQRPSENGESKDRA
jgi:energy-coupling factor transporter ATP-binding protein EcfA2